jgi:hypothetical protein
VENWEIWRLDKETAEAVAKKGRVKGGAAFFPRKRPFFGIILWKEPTSKFTILKMGRFEVGRSVSIVE